jgi:hypothetical protein
MGGTGIFKSISSSADLTWISRLGGLMAIAGA